MVLRWSETDIVLLDLDGTVIDLAFDNYLWRHEVPRQAARRLGLGSETLAEVIESARCERPDLSYYSVEHWSQTFSVDIVQVHRELRHLVMYRKGSLEFLRFCRECRKQVMIVSNAHPHALAVKDEMLGFTREVDATHSAFDIGSTKQHFDFWRILGKREGLDPRRTVLVDDSLPVVACAQEWGMGRVFLVDQPDMTLPPQCAKVPTVRFLPELMQSMA